MSVKRWGGGKRTGRSMRPRRRGGAAGGGGGRGGGGAARTRPRRGGGGGGGSARATVCDRSRAAVSPRLAANRGVRASPLELEGGYLQRLAARRGLTAARE